MGKSWENDGNLHGICQVGFHGCHGMICRLGFVLSQRDSAFLTPIMAWELPSWGLNPREELEGPGNYEVHDFFCSKKPWSSMVFCQIVLTMKTEGRLSDFHFTSTHSAVHIPSGKHTYITIANGNLVR